MEIDPALGFATVDRLCGALKERLVGVITKGPPELAESIKGINNPTTVKGSVTQYPWNNSVYGAGEND